MTEIGDIYNLEWANEHNLALIFELQSNNKPYKIFQGFLIANQIYNSISFCISALPPQYEYSSDYDNYDESLVNEEEETEIHYDIRFLSSGTTHVVDKGTTIKLPCNVDKYPGKKLFITFPFRKIGQHLIFFTA